MAENLHLAVEKLRTWLDTHPRCHDEYHHWFGQGGIASAIECFVKRVQPEYWTDENVSDLLLVLHQSPTEHIAELIMCNESMALAIARHSIGCSGLASDEIALWLGRCVNHREEAEELLIKFTQHSHERTRRIALLSLAKLQSASVEPLALAAWDTGEQYAQMGTLAALDTIGSPLFSVYLRRALGILRTSSGYAKIA